MALTAFMDGEMVDVELQTGQVTDSEAPAASIFKKINKPIVLKFENVVYKIKPKKGGVFNRKNKKSDEKIILKGISGVVKPGEMVAMLGPSGSGKTTLLTTLGGRLNSGTILGKITYNNKPFSNAMKRHTGFVTQDDVLHPHLTVTETLVFTALLRLPNTLTKDDKIKQAEAVITQLGLTNCSNNIIGGQLLRGISGGERKRVSIGQEMLLNPSLLLLDEPTSGLDSTTAQKIVSKLLELANGGRTLVMTIHQPSSRLYYMFHKVMLLSEGNVLYFGNGTAVLDYFASIGYAPSIPMNPSDFLLDLANGLTSGDNGEDQATVKQNLISAYKYNLSEKIIFELQEYDYQQFQDGNNIDDKSYGDWPTTWWQQFNVLLKRELKERKYQSFSALKIFQILTISFLSGLIWWKSNVSHLQDQLGLMFFTISFWNFFPMGQAIFTFPPERKILAKERSSGMYRLSAYFVSRIISDLPMELALPTTFLTIIYWMSGLKPTILNYVMTLFSLLFSVLVSQGLGFAIGALVMDQRSASTIGSVIMLSYNLTGGFYVQHVPAFIAWVKYISIALYSYKLILGSQYKPNDTYPCSNNNNGDCLLGDYLPIKTVGLDSYVISIFALTLMLVVYRLIAYIALTRIGVTKS